LASLCNALQAQIVQTTELCHASNNTKSAI